ncbi:hypothetical protein OG985_47620 [Streptomyces sp. NBC_00289]|uniref:hypothetical protein n=1 Tax=Streptomyces sp. NBC_00289 TaxID=2975703 RepID=UPI00324A8931
MARPSEDGGFEEFEEFWPSRASRSAIPRCRQLGAYRGQLAPQLNYQRHDFLIAGEQRD